MNRFILFLSFVLVPHLVVAGPAASCAAGAPYNPCCDMSYGDSIQQSEFSFVTMTFIFCRNLTPCVICGQKNGDNTASAAAKQADLHNVAQWFSDRNCWNGYVADSLGRNVQYLDWNTFNQNIQTSKCSVDFSVNGGYSEWSKSCNATGCEQYGTLIRSRTCTNPPPINNGLNCTASGPETDTTLQCYRTCGTSGANCNANSAFLSNSAPFFLLVVLITLASSSLF